MWNDNEVKVFTLVPRKHGLQTYEISVFSLLKSVSFGSNGFREDFKELPITSLWCLLLNVAMAASLNQDLVQHFPLPDNVYPKKRK